MQVSVHRDDDVRRTATSREPGGAQQGGDERPARDRDRPRHAGRTHAAAFRSSLRSTARLEQLLEQALETRFGRATGVFVRTPDELTQVIANNPFPGFAARDPSHLLVVFLKDAVSQTAVAAFQKAIKGPEQVGARGRHMYIVYPAGIGRSRIGTLPEAKVAATGTARNWNTVLKLAAITATP
jgi:uncharacterized protein (DUF1697 family)